MATIRHKCGNIISCGYSFIRLTALKLLYFKNIRFGIVERFSPNVVIDLDRKSKIELDNWISIHSMSRISAVSGGHLRIKKNTSMNVGCIVVCHNNIEIGENVSIGPNVMMFDHDHIMSKGNGVKNTPFKVDSIKIGNNTWIGAGTIILRGTQIGENCTIAAGSIVKGNIPDNTVFVQKRENTYLKEN